MREHIYEVSKGNDVLPEFIGQNVIMTRFSSLEEALSATLKNADGSDVKDAGGNVVKVYEDSDALLNAAESQRLIKMRAACRTVLGRRPVDGKEYVKPTLEEAAAAANGVTVNKRGEGVAAKPKTEKGIAKAAATDFGSKFFARYRDEQKFAERIDKMGGFEGFDTTREAYDAWLKVNPAPQPTA